MVLLAGALVVLLLMAFAIAVSRSEQARSFSPDLGGAPPTGGAGEPAPPAALPPALPPAASLVTDSARKSRAAQITSSFENSTTVLQYAYAENIGDGRGITAGRAGFTSGTSDLLLLVRRYSELKPDNPLARYIPALEAVNGTDSEEGLAGFTAAWAKAATDPAQRALQDDLVDELYFRPAIRLASQVGVRTALGQAIMWDTMIQQGLGGKNGTTVVIKETRATMGGDVVPGRDAVWLNAFLDARLHHLGQAYGDNPDAGASSRSRIDAFKTLIARGAFSLDPPLSWVAYGGTFTILR